MSSVFKYDHVTFEDYLYRERDAEYRSEYVDGSVYAMAGASRTHNSIATTFAALIETHLREECQVWQSDMKVAVKHEGKKFAFYPDIMAACDDEDDDYLCTSPVLIIEVLSRTTERIDLGEKFEKYSTIPSLLEYAVVSQDVPLVRLFRRRTGWEREAYRAEDIFRLESVSLDVPVLHIYRRVRKAVGLIVDS